MGQVLIKANRDKLIEHLVEERDTAVDAHYIEDFLLMYRVFISDPTMIFEKLMHWFAESNLRDRVLYSSFFSAQSFCGRVLCSLQNQSKSLM